MFEGGYVPVTGRRIPTLALAAVAALVAGVLHAPAAVADTAPPVAGTPLTASADVLPTVQVNGVVWAQVVVGNRVYVTGEFTSARPAGSPAGSNEVPRSNVLAYDLTTGALISSWAPSLNAAGQAIAASADGSRIFVGGNFTSATGVNRYRLVALDATTGAVVTAFDPAFNARVRSITVRGDTVYAGGIFTVVDGQPRTRLAAVSATTGALLPWAPSADAEVLGITAPVGTGNVVIGGKFTLVNSSATYGLGAVDGTSGAVVPFAASSIIRNAGEDAAIYSLTSSAGKVYGSGYTFGGGGNLEGTFAADAGTGVLAWISGCRGDTYSTAAAGEVLYSVGHPHDCSQLGSFPQTQPWTFQRAMAQAYDGRRVNTGGSFNGRPAPTNLHWLPTLNAGTYTGQSQAAWSVATNGTYVVLGGEFPSINGVAQQGLARFAVKEIAPNKQGPQGGTSMAPTLTAVGPGSLRFSSLAGWDRDNVRLKHEVLRGATLSGAVVIGTMQLDSAWWGRPSLAVVDTGAPPGSSQTYRVRMTDPFGNVAYSTTVTGTVPAGSPTTGTYRNRVVADGAVNHWRLGEASGTAYDWASQADLTPSAGTTRRVAGAISGDPNTAVTFPGTDTVPATTAGAAAYGPQTFTMEAWFRTTSVTGGKILGFGNRNTVASTAYDRHLYLTNTGQVVLGVSSGGAKTVTSPGTYNNGQWHHVVGSLGADGLKLYVDGALVGSRTDATAAAVYMGWWRVGGDTLSSSWPSRPLSNSIAGSLDEVAVYPTVLPAAAVLAHYQTGRGVVANQAPTAAFTSSTSNLTASVNGSGSTDSDGTIGSYAWNFGDGTTGTGVTASRTYAAAGTYQVTLTVTDDDGATGSVTRAVTVSTAAPPPPPPPTGVVGADAFGRVVATGLGTADTGGAWTVSATGSAVSVADGSARLAVPAGRTASARLAGASARDTDLVTTALVEQQPTGGGAYVSAAVRSTTAGEYRVRVRLQPTGQVLVNLSKVVGGVETAVSTQLTLPGVTYTPGLRLRLRLQAVGTGTTTLRAKVWPAASAEPTAWQVTGTDTSPELQSAGGSALVVYVSSSATATPVVRFDDLTATTL